MSSKLTHKRQSSSTPVTQVGERIQTHWEGGRETRGKAESPGGRRSRSKKSGMRHRQPGERERSQDGWWSSLSEKKKRGRENERERERERDRHTAWTLALVGQQTVSSINTNSYSINNNNNESKTYGDTNLLCSDHSIFSVQRFSVLSSIKWS